MTTINEHFIKYHPERLSFSSDVNKSALNSGVIIRIRLKQSPKVGKAQRLFEIPGALKIEAGVLSFPAALENMSAYRRSELYDVYADKDGNSPYIEAKIILRNKYSYEKARTMTLGLPLNLYGADKDYLYLLYDGVHLTWIAEGEAVNINFPFGSIEAENGDIYVSASAEVGICEDLSALESEEATELKNESISFYSARGYNAWGGDVVNFWHNGVYHFLVLFDRHHHGNRFGGGAHSTYHMTTRDFIHWENYGELYPLRSEWETFGTGTLVFHGGKYYYFHGLHTDRVIPRELAGSRLLEKNYERNGAFSSVTYDELEKNGLFPSGTAYAVSEDGIHFVPAKKQIHVAENPSVYTDKDGRLIMYAGYGASGAWRADKVDGPWVRVETDMPVFDNSSPVRNSSECPSVFEWNGRKYLIMGFRGYWQSGFGSNEFTDLAAVGDDIYDGLCVPMVANCNGRYILAGWVGGMGWAFVTLHRELILFEGGRLGIRWLPELTPDIGRLKSIACIEAPAYGAKLELDGRSSYYFECRVIPDENGRVGFAFSGSGRAFVFELNSARKKVQTREAQNADAFTEEVKALYEYIPEMPKERTGPAQLPSEDIHTNSHDFAIANVRELKCEYTLKVILHYEKKTDSLIMDSEIGGCRTFVSNRPYFRAESIKLLTEDARVADFKLYTGL